MKAKVWLKVGRSLFCLILLAAVAVATLATSVVIPTDDELAIGARAIVRGQVTNMASGYDEAHGGIFTYVTLQVAEVYKGKLQLGTLIIKEPGGITRDRGSVVYGTPTFTVGEEVLLYLDTWPDGSLRVYQWFLGKFTITVNPSTGQPIISREAPTQQVEIIGRSLNGTITDRAELDSYTNVLRARISATLIAAQQQEVTYYTNVPLLTRPPELIVSAGRQITPLFTLINPSRPPRWFEPDSNQPVVFRINPAGAYNAQIVNDVVAAMNAWSNTSGTSIRVINGGSTTGCGLTLLNNENTVSFNNCDNYSAFAPPPGSSCSGVLAAAGIVSYSLVQTRVINGTTFYRALEGNMSFNPYATCYFTSSCNIAEVATHELGHALGIGHSADTSATMYAYAHFDGRCAGLKTDDINAIRFIYPGSGTPAPTPTPIPTPTPTPLPLNITTTSLASGQAGSSYSQALAATGGTTPYNWSLVAGALPGGLSLVNTGAIGGTPNSAGTFNFTARVTDAATRTSQKALSITIIAAPPPPPSPPPTGSLAVRGDFDGDRKTDLSVWRGLTSYWYIVKSSSNTLQSSAWGAQYAPYYDIPAPGDYDGDGKVDSAVWRPLDGNWYVMMSRTNTYFAYRLGQSGDTPVAGDYDGDGVTDMAVWRGATGVWYIRQSSNGQTRTVAWGAAYAPYYDVPVPGDYDGDGRYDLAVWRQANSNWYISESSTGQSRVFQLGQNGDTPVPGDYDGDGKYDAAVWRGATTYWYIRQSSNGQTRTVSWGAAYAPYRDVPVPGDYDGDGRLDIAVWRQLDNKWYILQSLTNTSRIQAHGQSGDTPLPPKQP